MSPELLAHVKRSEGCRLTPYQDAVGVWTVGYGHTGPTVTADTEPISQEMADAILTGDLAHCELGVRALVPSLEGARLDALTDFAFNLGLHALKDSTMLICVREDDWFAAAKECKRWNHAGGKVLAGLTTRRAVEAGWLLTGAYALPPEEDV